MPRMLNLPILWNSFFHWKKLTGMTPTILNPSVQCLPQRWTSISFRRLRERNLMWGGFYQCASIAGFPSSPIQLCAMRKRNDFVPFIRKRGKPQRMSVR